eukprot:Cvel_21497.t1-p1 / transcript=Cvel_21497.t1 / gene=Cvel_21497 / organism=Chromera_velia_CCMP2878 / gene_product=hypothetical protein / transcript_product=hypothetical protein / location=Cvel_scaffold2022:1-3904(-) / protein_length=387 / sequence_SO=supercontig / SO=protein_coding / is_pseudo=false
MSSLPFDACLQIAVSDFLEDVALAESVSEFFLKTLEVESTEHIEKYFEPRKEFEALKLRHVRQADELKTFLLKRLGGGSQKAEPQQKAPPVQEVDTQSRKWIAPPLIPLCDIGCRHTVSCSMKKINVLALREIQLGALFSSSRVKPYWRFPTESRVRNDDAPDPTYADLKVIATVHGAFRCLKALMSLSPLLPAPSKELFGPKITEETLLPSLRTLLEARQIDPNGAIHGVPWLIRSLQKGWFLVAALLLEFGAHLDVWSYSVNDLDIRILLPNGEWREIRGQCCGQTPLHAFVDNSFPQKQPSQIQPQSNLPHAQVDSTKPEPDEAVPSGLIRQLVEGAKREGSLEWVAWSRKNMIVQGSALVLTAHKISIQNGESLSACDLAFFR